MIQQTQLIAQVNDLYKITLLSDISAIWSGARMVNDLYKITLLSDEGRRVLRMHVVNDLYKITLLSDLKFNPCIFAWSSPTRTVEIKVWK